MNTRCGTAFLATLGVAVALATPTHAKQESGYEERLEKKLSRWKPTKDNDHTPPADLRCTADDLSGKWSVSGAVLKITRLGPTTYNIEFATYGCLGSWTLSRTGTYKAGVLTLNRPVEEYAPISYQRLFTIRSPKGVRLVADAAVKNLTDSARRRRPSSGRPLAPRELDEFTIAFYTFGNKSRTVVAKPLPPAPPQGKTPLAIRPL